MNGIARLSTGVAGFDEVLYGGFVPGRTYLLTGAPGTGKTTLGWHFLTAGAVQGETTLYVTFAEPESELRANAVRSGFAVDSVHVVDLSPSSDVFTQAEVYDLFSAQEVEREPTTARIVEAIERLRPTRVFVDSMTSLRFLTTDAFQFRRQALSFLRYLASRDATVLVTSESTPETPDDDLRFIVDGVIELALSTRSWSLRVSKFRGSGFRNGEHGMRLGPDGASIYPRLLPEEHRQPVVLDQLASGLPGLDTMLRGGVERGTITLISGPTGVGKSSLAMTFLTAAAAEGSPAVMYTFDERPETVLRRSVGLGLPVTERLAEGTLTLRGIEALRYDADEFASLVRDDIAKLDTKMIALDSVSGYRMTIQGKDLIARLHAIGRYLQNIGVTLFLVDELNDLTSFSVSDVGISYLADNAIYLRYVERREAAGIALHKAIGIIKKRLGDFDKALREYELSADGIAVGGVIPVRSLLAASSTLAT